MSLEDLLRNKAFMTKMALVGFLMSLVFIAIGIYIIMQDIFG